MMTPDTIHLRVVGMVMLVGVLALVIGAALMFSGCRSRDFMRPIMSLPFGKLDQRWTMRVAGLVCLAVSLACTGYRPLSRAPLPRDEVRMTFLSPRNLVGRTEAGRSVPLNSVTEVRGRIAAIAADSVRLFVASARGPDGELGGIPSDVIVAIPRDWYPLVQERYTSAKPLKWIGYAALGALAILVLAVGLALEET